MKDQMATGIIFCPFKSNFWFLTYYNFFQSITDKEIHIKTEKKMIINACFECDICEKTYKKPVNLKRHYKFIHKIERSTTNSHYALYLTYM